MKTAIGLIIAVAILGAVGIYVTNKPEPEDKKTASAEVLSLKDGSYTGSDAETPYGDVQVSIVVSGGKISDVQYLKMPNGDERSREITKFSSPELKKNTLKAQGGDIDFVSGATSTSYGYQQSLQAALDKAAGSSVLNYKIITG